MTGGEIQDFSVNHDNCEVPQRAYAPGTHILAQFDLFCSFLGPM